MKSVIEIAETVRFNPGLTANAIAAAMGLRISGQYASRRWYAAVKAACEAGAIVAADGPPAWGRATTVYGAL